MGLTDGVDVFVEDKNLLTLPGFEPPTVQPVAWSFHSKVPPESEKLHFVINENNNNFKNPAVFKDFLSVGVPKVTRSQGQYR